MSEHEHTEPEQDERSEDVEDLDVPEEQATDVAGGSESLIVRKAGKEPLEY